MTVDSSSVRVSTRPSRPPREPDKGAQPPGGRRTGPSITGRALILGLVVVTLAFALAVPVRAWFAQRAEIAELRAGVESARERVAALEDQKARWEDPAFVAAQARERLHFVLPGEVGFVALGLDSVTGPSAAEAAASRPWYDSLWRSVQRADDKAPAAPSSSTTPARLPAK